MVVQEKAALAPRYKCVHADVRHESHTGGSDMVRAGLASFAFLSAFAFALTAPVSFDISKGGLTAKAAFAKNGADDPAGHNVGDDRGRNRGRGADDRTGHH
jgi:hypothetical protein